MTPRYLLDTNICISIRQRRPAAAVSRFGGIRHGDAALSVITYGELARGVQKSTDPQNGMKVLAELLLLIPVLPLPSEAGLHYGRIRAALERGGSVIGNNDLWIAAHALCGGLVLVTNNEREFTRVPGLEVENWIR